MKLGKKNRRKGHFEGKQTMLSELIFIALFECKKKTKQNEKEYFSFFVKRAIFRIQIQCDHILRMYAYENSVLESFHVVCTHSSQRMYSKSHCKRFYIISGGNGESEQQL